jgi:hypothetical protein
VGGGTSPDGHGHVRGPRSMESRYGGGSAYGEGRDRGVLPGPLSAVTERSASVDHFVDHGRHYSYETAAPLTTGDDGPSRMAVTGRPVGSRSPSGRRRTAPRTAWPVRHAGSVRRSLFASGGERRAA